MSVSNLNQLLNKPLTMFMQQLLPASRVVATVLPE
jgi:hypothetical protein